MTPKPNANPKNLVVSVVGPTSSGKTSVALQLAKSLLDAQKVSGVDIISADSCQVYQGLEVLSGADIPEGFVEQESAENRFRYYKNTSIDIALHGVSILAPTEEWSVGHFQKMAQQIIHKSLSDGRLPVVVGGTGLYHRHLLSTDEQLHIPPDPDVRKKAMQMTLGDLQSWAAEESPEMLRKMNNSDINNPRRLVRAIEIGRNLAGETAYSSPLIGHGEIEHIFIGLKLDKEELEKRISQRVKERFDGGAVQEVEHIYNRHISSDSSLGETKKVPAFSTLGFKEILKHMHGQISRENCREIWEKRENSYAKRQMTWFKKNQEINWFKASEPQLEARVYQLLAKYI